MTTRRDVATMIALVVACGALAACGGSPPAPREPAAPAGLERFLPLHDKDIYTYETLREDTGARDMFMVRVQRRDPGTADLVSGASVRSLLIEPSAIRRREGGFLLKLPLQVGSEWPGDNGGQTRVVDTNASVDVPAGKFHGCVRTVEEIAAGAKGRITTTYCPLVGIAQMIVEEESEGDHVTQRVSLRAYGAPMDLSIR
jgi:hypothetical protein